MTKADDVINNIKVMTNMRMVYKAYFMKDVKII
jgi:hypothetical protein